jgi:HEAT repeat protein
MVLAALESFNESSRDLILPLIDIAGKRHIEEAMPVFKALLKGNDSRLRESALQALSALGTQESLDAMISCLNDADPGIRQKVQSAITQEFGKDALGALIRALPADHNSPLYFEIVGILEDLDLFSDIKANFAHPDLKIKDFYFDTLARFTRQDFLPLYLDFYGKASQARKDKMIDIFKEYSVQELLPFFKEKLMQGNVDGLTELCDRVLLPQFSNGKNEVLTFVASIADTRYRYKVMPELLKQIDPYCFDKTLELLRDGSSDIRSMAVNALSQLIKKTFERMNDKAEPNKMALASLYDAWEKTILSMMRDKLLPDEQRKLSRRLFYALAQNRHALVRPFIRELFQKNFHETYLFLKEWQFEEQFNLFEWLISSDPSFGSLLLTAIQGNVDDNLWRIVLKLLSTIADQEDRELFKRNLVARNRNISIEKFLKDSDVSVRVAAIEFASECRINGLTELLKNSTKDPSPDVRIAALRCMSQQHFQQFKSYAVEALGDPDENVAFNALQHLQTTMKPAQLAPLVIKFINSNNEKLRSYALNLIAELSKERFKANFNNLNPETRKLAAKVIQKLDHGFSEQIIQDLTSLDPQTRLRSALLLENIQLDDKGKDSLLAAMKDPSKLVRAAVVKTLGVIGDQRMIKQLISFFNDPDPRVRANTIEAISSLGDRQAIQVLLPFLDDANNRIRANAIVGIYKIGNFNLIPVLQKMLTHKDKNMRASALWAMGEIQDANFLNYIFPFLNDREELLRFNAVRAISRINPQMLSQYLPNLRKDPAAKIRKLVTELSFKVL